MTDKNQLFLKLLKQVGFSAGAADEAVLQAGEIKNVDVYRKERRWDIHVFFTTPLRFESYNALNQAIKHEFNDFVDTRLIVETADGQQQYLPDYWQYAVENSEVLSANPAAQNFLVGQAPHEDSGRWVIPINGQLFDKMLEQRLLDSFSLELRNYGFFNVKLLMEVTDQGGQSDFESLAQLVEAHEKNMQKAFQQAPAKPKGPAGEEDQFWPRRHQRQGRDYPAKRLVRRPAQRGCRRPCLQGGNAGTAVGLLYF